MSGVTFDFEVPLPDWTRADYDSCSAMSGPIVARAQLDMVE